jgi:tetratricopeptide (TPR) repeat protein
MAHEHIVYMMLVDSAVIARERTIILKYAPLLEKLASRDDHQLYLAISSRAFGIAHILAEEYEQAETRLQQALKIFEELETLWQLGRTLSELGELAKLRGNDELSKAMYTLALEKFEEIKAKPDAARMKELLGR